MDDILDMEDTTKLVYICSNHERDPRVAEFADKLYCYLAMGEEHTPVAPYLIFPQMFNSDFSPEGKVRMYDAEKLLSKCDELWVMQYGKITDEMAAEIRFAKKNDIPVRYRIIMFEDIVPDEVMLKQRGFLDLVDREADE